MAGNTPSIHISDENIADDAPVTSGKRFRALLRLLQIVIDFLMLVGAFVLGYLSREILPFFPFPPNGQPPIYNYMPTLVLHVSIIILMFYFNQLYHQRRVFSRFDHIRSIISVVTLGAVLVYGTQELIFRNSFLYVDYPRSMFVYVWFFSVILCSAGRECHRVLQIWIRQQGFARDNLLIVGSGGIARDITGKIKSNHALGYNIVGVVTAKDEHQGRMLGIPVIGNYPALPNIIDEYQVNQVIIALPDARRSELVELITLCQRGQVDIKVYPDIFAYMAGDMNVDDLGGTPLLTVRDIALRGWKLSLKRGLDVFGASMGLVILSPFMLLTALITWFQDRGPVFYTQERMGLDGRPFPMIKFRTMRVGADKMADWTVEDDPRVTPIGQFMRRTNWDEIPQLMNVLLGHMSLVGPRPEQPQYVQEFRQHIPRYMERHREKAGMTGWAQIHGLRGDTSIGQRTRYDLWYVENWSLWLDIKIIIRTIYQSVTGNSPNAY